VRAAGAGPAERLAALGIALPPVPRPSANYLPVVRRGGWLLVSGQVPRRDGRDLYVGKLGREFGVAEGREAARLCAINVIAQVAAALGGELDRVGACLRLGGFVNAMPDFTELPAVVDGASDLMVEVFGEAGRHARAAVGCASLPRDVAVEIDAIFAVDDAP